MLDQTGQAPYAPVKAINLVIDTYRDKSLSLPVTASVIERTGVEPSLSQRSFSALKQLDLLDEAGQPTELLKKIKVAPSDQLQDVLAEWVQSAYAPIFQYVNATDPVQRITDQFRHYDPSGMRPRMVTLFLGLCVRAGLLDEMPAMPRGTKPAPNGERKKASTAPRSPATKAKPLADPKVREPGEPDGLAAVRQRYVDLLITKAEAMEQPDSELLDRIERALGIGGTSP